MKSKIEYIFEFPADFLMEQYCSKSFYEARMEIDGIEDAQIVSFENKDNKASYCIDRHVEIHTDRAPKFIQKIADTLIHDAVTVSTEGEWDANKMFGRNYIKAHGVPVYVDVAFQFSPEDNNTTKVKTQMEIKAKIPLVGKQLEKFMLPKMEKIVVKDFDRASDYFKSL